MKSFFPLLAFLCFNFTSYSQFLVKEGVIQELYDYHIENTELLPNNTINITGYGGINRNRGSFYINYGFNWQGNLENSNIRNVAQDFHYVKNPTTQSTEIWSTGINRVFCVDCMVGMYGNWSIFKEDLVNGEYSVIDPYQYYYDEPYYQGMFNNNYPSCKGLVYTSSGKIITASDDVFCKMPTNNDVYGDFLLNVLSVNSLAILPFVSDTFLVVSNQVVVKMDTLGNVFPHSTLPFTIDKIDQFTDSTYLVTSGRKYFIMDLTLNFLDSLDLNSIPYFIHSVRYKNNTFYALISNNNIHKIISGNSLTNTTEWQIDSEGFKPQFFEVNLSGDSTFVFGYETGHQNFHLMYQLYANTDAAYIKSNFDVTLGNLVSSVIPPFSCNAGNITYDFIDFTPTFQVLNNTSETITELYVNGDYTFQSLNFGCNYNPCIDSRFYQKLNVFIAPFSEQIITFPSILINSNQLIINYCYWLTAPEGQADRNPSDNMACDLINVGVENIEAAMSFNLYPNPTTNIITIQLENNNLGTKNIQVLSVIGKLVNNIQSNDSTIILDLSKEAKGIYFIQVSDNNGISQTRKVVVQ